MTIPPQEAADALDAVHRAQRRSSAAFHEHLASPYLILWGLIWIVGYGACFAWPSEGNFFWPVLVPIGVVASFWIGSRSRGRLRPLAWRYWASFIAVFLFIIGLYAILPPRSGNQAAALFPILIALWYMLQGIWWGAARFTVLGLALGALTMAGFFWLPQYFLLWMAGVGGGALILGGFWMRGV